MDNVDWNSFFLPNVPIYETKLPDTIVNRLWKYVNDASIGCNKVLAGNITESYELTDDDDYFFNEILSPLCERYISENNVISEFQTNHIKATELCLNKFWVNYQYKHEFNPMHCHSGVISFVIWLNIPTNWEEQHELPISKNSNSPSASDFSFSYTDICGNIQAYAVNLAPKDNGLMLVFPASLNHLVYPFYECDSKRVSLSGNICWK